ncbi:hypothetical protein QYE76_047496 [Lolium multiflorum]|uniref:Integrase catalytic domain-containing protein n=1 Tax=Lolium multiflorum TaxID=4521 RepID=A0AAD8TRZ8_LOLMU|nr:hypothetical protein QYE76_047496 [Lolium multiflorum]
MVCADRGVQRHLSAPYAPQHNGVVERRNQTVAATACSMLNPEPLLHARRGQQDANGGGLAEYAVAPAALTVARPPEVSAVDGACLPAAASSALQLLKATGVSFDGTSNATGPKNVLVTAASGGVGHYAVQLAKLAGMHVTATCGARNVAFVQGLGTDEVLDYKTPEGAALRSPCGGELRGGGGLAGAQGGAGGRGRHGRRRHAGGPRHAHVAPAESDVGWREREHACGNLEREGSGTGWY